MEDQGEMKETPADTGQWYLQDILGRKIGPDLSIGPLQKHYCFSVVLLS
jgi:hypothetical protein